MRPIRFFVIATLLLPGGALFAASKEQMEMQRDIAQLQSQVQQLQSTFDKQMATIQTLVSQALDAAGKANTNVSVLNAGVTSTLERELSRSLTPIAGLAAKVDNTNNDAADLRNQVTDLNTSMNKVLQTLADMNNMIKVLSAPPAPPPAATTPPPVSQNSAEAMFNNATRDQNGGNLELAIQEWADFIKFHPDDPNCASAQYNIGEIHYTLAKLDLAVQDFDAVIERYPDNKLTPDAYFMKAMALKKDGKSVPAKTTFRALIAKFPKSPKAEEAREMLSSMGAATPAATKKKAH